MDDETRILLLWTCYIVQLLLLTCFIVIFTIAFSLDPTRERRRRPPPPKTRTILRIGTTLMESRRKLAKQRILRELKEIRNDQYGITKSTQGKIRILLVKDHHKDNDTTTKEQRRTAAATTTTTQARGIPPFLEGILSSDNFKGEDDKTNHNNNETTMTRMLTLKAIIDGPDDSPYQQGQFTIDIQIPDQYPLVPPKMKFVTKIWHPNISADDGSIYIDILSSANWSPAWTIQHVLLTLMSVMAKPVLLSGPTKNRQATQMYLINRTLYNKTAQEWTKQYAKRKMVPLSQQIQLMDQLTEMGFQPRELVQSTLIRCDWNPTAAMEELLARKDEDDDGTKDSNAVDDDAADTAEDIASTTSNNNNNNNDSSSECEITDGMATLELLGDGDDGIEATTTLQEQVADEEIVPKLERK